MSEARELEHIDTETGEIQAIPLPVYDESPAITELVKALAKAQAVMKPALKKADNPYFKSKYSDLATVWEVAQGPLADNGLVVMQPISMTPDGKGVVVTTRLLHTSGEWMRSTSIWPARPEYSRDKAGNIVRDIPPKVGPQGLGSAATYGRRYSLAAMLGIVSDDDDGERAEGRTEKDAKAAQPAIPREPKPAPPPPPAKRTPAKPAPEPPPPTEPPANVAKFPEKPAPAPDPLPPPEPAPAEPPANQRVELLAQVKAVMEARLVGEKSTEAKRNLMKQAFGKEKWSEICVLAIPQLITGLTLLQGGAQ